MPAIQQSNYTAEGKAVPPVKHRAVLACPVRLPSAFAKRDWAKKVQQLKRSTEPKSNG